MSRESACDNLTQIECISEPLTPSVLSWLENNEIFIRILANFVVSRMIVVGVEGCFFQIHAKKTQCTRSVQFNAKDELESTIEGKRF